MSEALLKQLDVERHARLFQRAIGSSPAIAVCDRSGEVAWASEPPVGIARIVASKVQT